MTPLNVSDDYESFLEAKTTTSTPNPLEHPPESRKDRDKAKAKVEKAAENKNVLSATSGDAEEVAVDEMPPETAALPVVEQTVAEINMKGIKKAIKFIFSIPMVLFTLILAYCDWITLTFAVNKCASLDLFEQEADQFPALLPGEELAESAELDSEV
ncbi:MAG: hypothetical protein KVP17_002524 [Porospora cf. gigantea B]|uniref:uncharacterized protein n=1 Tax=Porospora cf. gigantea B TaxID=2853592 RepID=UPI00357190BC|nr:MAG: hypothetical protein KVP17_002524 [Porospora cf. gigantea B]